MSKNYKVYGNEPTHLRLTEKAERYCSATDPIEIREFCHERDVEDEDGNIIDVEKTYSYDLIGGSEDYDMTEEELIELLEYLADYFDEIQEQDDATRYTIVKETTNHENGWNTVEELERLTTLTDEAEARKEAYLLNRSNTEAGIFYSLAVEPRKNGESLGEYHIESEDLTKIHYYFD